MKEYDEIIDWYISQRDPEIGVDEISRLAGMVPVGSTVLDIGCGDGIPITKSLIDHGCSVYGIDSSPKMIDRFKVHFPDVTVQCADALNSEFFDLQFDAIVAYGMIFHLTQFDQARLIQNVSEHLIPGGLFLFNSGDEDGESMSVMNGIRIKQYSMSSARYNETLHDNGMVLMQGYPDSKSGGYIYLGKKLGPG